ncbi:hypothetical protein Stsp02_42130 [Streptomyces sp. NBRC 14336]|nr:hypothetical protein Stsp02_42130 [Streptomyces sp. NBRC 14336]
MQGTAAAPRSSGTAASDVPDAPATSARAASIAILVRLMSAGSFVSMRGFRYGKEWPEAARRGLKVLNAGGGA